MVLIQISILGPVAFEHSIHSEVGCRYDVPVDSLGIPYIPSYEILIAAGGLPAGTQIGFAHPDGYMGQLRAARTLKNYLPGCSRYISDRFLTRRYDAGKGYSIRALKPGQTYTAWLSCAETDRAQTACALEKITRLGIRAPEDGISGEVRVRLAEQEAPVFEKPVLHEKCTYASLDLEILTISPFCLDTPFSDHAKTELFVPGTVIRDFLMKRMGACSAIGREQLICSNAYLAFGRERLLPTPVCISVVKLDRKQLRYRLAPGKDPLLAEQDVGLNDTFATGIQEHLTRYTVPGTDPYLAKDGQVHETIAEGQAFRGTVYGPDAAIRQIVESVSRFPVAQLGMLTEEGLGEVYFRIPAVNEAAIPAEQLSRCFDVCCLSDTLILNDRGVPDCRAESLLSEIEYVLGCPGKLRITGKYTAIHEDYSRNPGQQEDRTVVRCLAKGSILRLEAVDAPLDISRLSHCFLGERTEDGYGELAAWPARGTYYRLAEELVPDRYEVPVPLTYRDSVFGAQLTVGVINSMIRERVYNLGLQDRGDLKAGAEKQIPEDLLHMIRDMYSPVLTDEQLIGWYQDGLTGGTDHEDE